MGLLREVASRIGAPVADHPLATVGAVAAVLAGAYTLAGIRSYAGASASTATADPVLLSAALEFGLAHPAYPAAVLAGLAVLAYARRGGR